MDRGLPVKTVEGYNLPSRPTEFEVQADAYAALRAAGYRVRGEVDFHNPEGRGARFDLVVFDDDLVKLGLRAKWIEEKGGDYSGAKAEFDGKVDRALARYKGSHIGTFGTIRGGPNYVTQYKGWSI